MLFKALKIIFVSLIFLVSVSSAQASNPLDVVINEIAWIGTEISYSDEWIELYNNTDSPINLEGWILKAADGTPEINLAGAIPALGYYLLERTDDTTVPNITADQIYKGALENKGEALELYDNFGNLIDRIDCSSGWFSGDNKTKQTMERINSTLPGSHPGSWETSQTPGGTPKSKNSPELTEARPIQPLQPEETAGAEPMQTQAQTEEPKTIYPSDIVFSEVLPSPEGPDAKEEWIEVFNQNNFEVDLSFWQISDTIGRTKTYVLPKGIKISAHGFLVLARPETKITLNNDGDGLNLVQPNGNIIDTITYEKAPRGKSYNLTESGWTWSNILTPGSENVIQELKETGFKSQLKPEEKPEPEISETEEAKIKKELATIVEQAPKEAFPFLPLLIAFGVAIFSGVIVLILKNKIKKLTHHKK